MGLIFRTARLYTRGTNLASAMSFPSARPCIRPVHPQSVSLRAACPRAFRARGYPRNRRHFCPGDRPPRVVPSVPDRFSLAQTRATLALLPIPWLFQRQENLTADDRATWPRPSGPSHISRRTLPPRRLRPHQATKEQGSSGQSYVLHIVPHFAVADFKLEQLLAGSQSCLSNPQRLDAGPEWEDNTGWSGTSKQVRTRKPFEP
jgi:hypothetical protein